MAEVGSEEDIRSQWTTFLDQPGARTALLQTGLALMQPPSFGDTPVSQIGRAIGAGGEALGRQEEMDRRQMEAESKASAREAAASLAEARARTTGTAAQLTGEKIAAQLALGRERIAAQSAIAQAKSLSDLHDLYNKYATDILTPKPAKSFEDWVASDPGAREVLRRAGGLGGAPAAAPTAPATAPAPAPAAGAAGSSATNPVTVKSPDEARKQPSGTWVRWGTGPGDIGKVP